MGTKAEEKVAKTDAEWRAVLTQEQYRITRAKQNELPFSGEYNRNLRNGVYECVCCSRELFSSDAKFEAGTGWPSFWAPIRASAVETRMEVTGVTLRQEVRCGCCDAYLGHVFTDGPKPTGLRYCINSGALKFVERE